MCVKRWWVNYELLMIVCKYSRQIKTKILKNDECQTQLGYENLSSFRPSSIFFSFTLLRWIHSFHRNSLSHRQYFSSDRWILFWTTLGKLHYYFVLSSYIIFRKAKFKNKDWSVKFHSNDSSCSSWSLFLI